MANQFFFAFLNIGRKYPILLTLYGHYSKKPVRKKWLSCSNLVHIMNRPYMFSTPRTKPNLLTLYVQYTKTLTIEKWLLFELICAV